MTKAIFFTFRKYQALKVEPATWKQFFLQFFEEFSLEDLFSALNLNKSGR